MGSQFGFDTSEGNQRRARYALVEQWRVELMETYERIDPAVRDVIDELCRAEGYSYRVRSSVSPHKDMLGPPDPGWMLLGPQFPSHLVLRRCSIVLIDLSNFHW